MSCTLAVVTSAVNDTTSSPTVVDVKCSLYPKTHPLLYGYSPTLLCINARMR